MTAARPVVRVVPGRFAVCRLAPDAALPVWVLHQEARFYSITRTPEELSVVCDEDDLPPSVGTAERGWRALALAGPIPFDAVGVIAALTEPLARFGIAVFVISTHDTDWMLVRHERLPEAIEALRLAGFTVETGAATRQA